MFKLLQPFNEMFDFNICLQLSNCNFQIATFKLQLSNCIFQSLYAMYDFNIYLQCSIRWNLRLQSWLHDLIAMFKLQQCRMKRMISILTCNVQIAAIFACNVWFQYLLAMFELLLALLAKLIARIEWTIKFESWFSSHFACWVSAYLIVAVILNGFDLVFVEIIISIIESVFTRWDTKNEMFDRWAKFYFQHSETGRTR